MFYYLFFFFFNDTATTEIYTLSLHDALPIWLQLVQDQRVQRGAVVPSMVQILLGAPLEEYDLSSLRYLNCGAPPLSVEVANEFERRVPGVELCEGYGSTEAGAVVAVNRLGARKLGSVGPPIPGCEVRVVDEEDQALPVGEV